MSQSTYNFYVSFSGESKTPINNIYAISSSGVVTSTAVLDPPPPGSNVIYDELRGMVFWPDGNFFVANANKEVCSILQFSGTPDEIGVSRAFINEFVTRSDSLGLLHPYQPIFGPNGNLFVSSQDTNVVSEFYGPETATPGQPLPNSLFLQNNYPDGIFNPGTFVPAYTADKNAPKFTPVPVNEGGLTFKSKHSVRGVAFDGKGNLYVADEGNNRVAVFDAEGFFLGAVTQSKNHSLSGPVALLISENTLYIGSPGNQRIFTYDVSGVKSKNFEANVLFNDSKLDKLSGIALDPENNIYTGCRADSVIYQWVGSGSGTYTGTVFAGPFEDTPEQIIIVYG